jgi:zinc transport system ATP-binding protein
MPVIKVNNLYKSIDDRQILDNVSFAIEPASLVSLIGPNGAGKTSVLKIILGLDDKYTGEVTIQKSEKISYIPQLKPYDNTSLPLSVEEFLKVALAYKKNTEDINLVKSLEHVGLSKNHLKQSFNSLSGGEQQRVAIARALLTEPTTLILDEPLSAVDHRGRPELYALIRHLQKVHKTTLLLVSHDIDSVLPISDRVLCLNKTISENCHPHQIENESDTKTFMRHHC